MTHAERLTLLSENPRFILSAAEREHMEMALTIRTQAEQLEAAKSLIEAFMSHLEAEPRNGS